MLCFRIMLFSSGFAITEKRDMGLYEVLLSMSLLGLGMGTMLSNFYMGGILLVLRAFLNMLVRNASPRGPMCFRCLMFNLFYCLLDLTCSECDVISLCDICYKQIHISTYPHTYSVSSHIPTHPYILTHPTPPHRSPLLYMTERVLYSFCTIMIKESGYLINSSDILIIYVGLYITDFFCILNLRPNRIICIIYNTSY